MRGSISAANPPTLAKTGSLVDRPIIHIAGDSSDEQARNDLVRHLRATFGRLGATIVHAGSIRGGANEQESLKEQILSADVIVLVLSAHFFANEFCASVAMEWALARHAARDFRDNQTKADDIPPDWPPAPASNSSGG